MLFFKLKISIQHKNFKSISTDIFIKKKKVDLLLKRLNDKDFIVIFYLNFLSYKDINIIFQYLNIDFKLTKKNNINIDLLNSYAQDKNIKFK